MKITKVNTTVVQNEPPYVGGKYFLFLHLETDEGIVGIGEKVTGSSFNNSNWSDFKSQINLINETAEAFVIGESPFNIEKIWQMNCLPVSQWSAFMLIAFQILCHSYRQ